MPIKVLTVRQIFARVKRLGFDITYNTVVKHIRSRIGQAKGGSYAVPREEVLKYLHWLRKEGYAARRLNKTADLLEFGDIAKLAKQDGIELSAQVFGSHIKRGLVPNAHNIMISGRSRRIVSRESIVNKYIPWLKRQPDMPTTISKTGQVELREALKEANSTLMNINGNKDPEKWNEAQQMCIELQMNSTSLRGT